MPAADRKETLQGGRKDGLDGHELSRGKGIFFLTILIFGALNGSVARQG
jgi:hypothetical protein